MRGRLIYTYIYMRINHSSAREWTKRANLLMYRHAGYYEVPMEGSSSRGVEGGGVLYRLTLSRARMEKFRDSWVAARITIHSLNIFSRYFFFFLCARGAQSRIKPAKASSFFFSRERTKTKKEVNEIKNNKNSRGGVYTRDVAGFDQWMVARRWWKKKREEEEEGGIIRNIRRGKVMNEPHCNECSI